MAKLESAHVQVAMAMVERAVPVRQIARQLGVTEGAVRYRLRSDPLAPDGRRDRSSALDGWEAQVEALLVAWGDARVGAGEERHQARAVYDALVRDHGFRGSYQALRRYLKRRYGSGRVQAVRRVETPPGVQAQHDWFEFDGTIAGEAQRLYGLIGTLAHSRASFAWVSPTMTQVAWQTGHLALFHRYGGVPLWVRIDNLGTGVVRGAGSTAVLSPAFRTFARTCGFEIDPCRPRMASDKGKVERRIRTDRGAFTDLLARAWPSLGALQEALDARATELHTRLRSPATGTVIAEALAAERHVLRPVPVLGEPFDVVVARRVSRDCLVSFEGRRYSVPFAWVGHDVEVLGTARHVVMRAGGEEIARHARRTRETLVLTPAHYDGNATAAVAAPTPLGMRARLQLAGWSGADGGPLTFVPRGIVGRPLTEYVALIDRLGGGGGRRGFP